MTCYRDLNPSLAIAILMTVLDGLQYAPSASSQTRLMYVMYTGAMGDTLDKLRLLRNHQKVALHVLFSR